MSELDPPTRPEPDPAGPAPAGRRLTAATLVVLLGLLGATAGVMGWAWVEIGEAELTTHGWVALGLGTGLTFLLGAGLMALVFFSSRRGYDERAHDWSRDRGGTSRPPGEDR